MRRNAEVSNGRSTFVVLYVVYTFLLGLNILKDLYKYNLPTYYRLKHRLSFDYSGSHLFRSLLSLMHCHLRESCTCPWLEWTNFTDSSALSNICNCLLLNISRWSLKGIQAWVTRAIYRLRFYLNFIHISSLRNLHHHLAWTQRNQSDRQSDKSHSVTLD